MAIAVGDRLLTLRAYQIKSVFLVNIKRRAPKNRTLSPTMPPTTPPLDFDHLPGQEIPTKHKEAIRQLYGFAKVLIEALIERYRLRKTTINRVLSYNKLERVQETRTGRLTILSDSRVDEIIEHLSESWDNRILKYSEVVEELELPYSAASLELRLK
jgi:hypothetical protein